MTKKEKSNPAFDMAVHYKKTFSTLSGKKVIKDLMKSCHFIAIDCDLDPHKMYFENGERAILMRILAAIDMDLEVLRQTTNEIYEEGEQDGF